MTPMQIAHSVGNFCYSGGKLAIHFASPHVIPLASISVGAYVAKKCWPIEERRIRNDNMFVSAFENIGSKIQKIAATLLGISAGILTSLALNPNEPIKATLLSLVFTGTILSGVILTAMVVTAIGATLYAKRYPL